MFFVRALIWDIASAVINIARNGQFKRHLYKLIHWPDDLDGYAPFLAFGNVLSSVRISVAAKCEAQVCRMFLHPFPLLACLHSTRVRNSETF